MLVLLWAPSRGVALYMWELLTTRDFRDCKGGKKGR
jgi:hypothetical protein